MIGSEQDFLTIFTPSVAAAVLPVLRKAVGDAHTCAATTGIKLQEERSLCTYAANAGIRQLKNDEVVPGLVEETSKGQTLWGLGHYWLRTKTLTPTFRYTNSRTKQQDQISRQMTLDDLAPRPFVVVGPRFDQLSGEVVDFVCVKYLPGAQEKQQVEWWIDIEVRAGGALATPVAPILPLPGPDPSIVQPAAIVPKRRRARHKEQEHGS